MIIEQTTNNTAIEAVIYLKNGNRKYGMILENSLKDVYHFISNANYKLFNKTKDESYIEIVPETIIEKIDTSQK
ncbi:MAG: hypothetical protein ACXVDT_16240 [Bacteroidia bacterium]